MKRFRWPLERVRRVREIQEEVARAEWAQAERRSRVAEEHVRELRTARDSARTALSFVPGQVIDAARAVLERDVVDRASRDLAHARERAKTLAFQAARLRAPWEERRRDVRGFEKLRTRASDIHRRETRRKEAAQLDEISQARAAARSPRHTAAS